MERDERRRRTPARREEEYGSAELKFGEFWYDAKNNPYASWAAGFGIGIPASWISLAAGYEAMAWGNPFMVVLGLLFTVPTGALLLRGMSQFRRWGKQDERSPKVGRERELLLAILDSGGRLTPIEAALETSVSVEEAEDTLSRLAERGHLMVESRDGALFYVMPGRYSERRLGDRTVT